MSVPRSDTRSPDHLLRDKSLVESYDVHDIAQAYVIERLERYAFDVAEIGLDDRYNSGQLTYSDVPDLAVRDQHGNVRGYVEVKSKTSEKWLGILNERHWENYLWGGGGHDERRTTAGTGSDSAFEGAAYIDRPVWIHMSLVDEAEHRLHDTFTVRVSEDTTVARTFNAPDGNQVVVIDEGDYQRWSDMMLSMCG